MQKTVITILLVLVGFITTSVQANEQLQQVQGLINNYGKADLMEFILKISPDSSVTVQVGKTLYKKHGRQDTDYITIYSIAYDLKRLKLTPNQIKNDISTILKKKEERSKRISNITSRGQAEKTSRRPATKAKAISIVEIERRHTAENPIKLRKITSMVDESSTIDNVIIEGKAGIKFYNIDIYEKYNLFKFVVLYFWYYIDRNQVVITYETNKGDFKKILVHRKDVERLTGDLNQLTRKQAGDIRYNKGLAKRMFSAYIRLK